MRSRWWKAIGLGLLLGGAPLSVERAPASGSERQPTLLGWSVDLGHVAEAAKKKRRRRRKKKRAEQPAPAPAPVEPPAPSAAAPVAPTRRGPTRIDFDERLVQGQTNQSGAVVLFSRKASGLRSMIDRRRSFRRQTLRTIYED